MKLSWTEFRNFCTAKGLKMQLVRNTGAYYLQVSEHNAQFNSSVFKDSPASADQIEFETYYLPKINEPQSLLQVLDDVGGGILYVGYCTTAGTATSAAAWQIKKLITIGTETKTYLADGNFNFDNIWNNRLSLSYS